MTIRQENKKGVYARIKSLEVAESCALDLSEYKYIGLKSSVYNISRDLNRKYKTKQCMTQDDRRVLVITRIA